mgnify:CR=1 FL=1
MGPCSDDMAFHNRRRGQRGEIWAVTGRTQSPRLAVIVLVLSAGILAAAQVGKVPPLLPAIRGELALTLVEAGWMTSLTTLTGALFGATFGFLADRLGAARMLLAGLALLAGAGLAGAAAVSGSGLAGTRALESIGLIAVVVAGPRLLYSASPQRLHGLTLGLWGCYMPAGMALIMFATPMLHGLGWRDIWLVNAAVLALLLLTAGIVMRPIRAPAASAARAAPPLRLRVVLTRPAPWVLAACFGLYSMQWFAVAAWLPTYLIESLGHPPAQAARITAAVVAVNVAGNIAGAWLIHRGVARARLVALAYLAMAASAVGIFSGGSGALTPVIAAILFSGLGGILPAAVMAGAARHAPGPAQVGLVTGIIIQGANLGSLAGPPVTAGAVLLLGGWERLHWPLLAASTVGLLLAAALARLERR